MNKFKQIKIDYRFRLKIIASAKNKTWNEAQEWVKEQGGRVPTVAELQILSALQCMGKLDTKFNGWFWSSEEGSSSPQDFGRYVYFDGGSAGYGGEYSQGQVICVKDI